MSTRHGRGLPGLLLLGAATGCILHTGDINSYPEVVKVSGPVEIFKSKPALFQAEVRDPNQPPQTLAAEWRIRPGTQTCPLTLEDAVKGGTPLVRGTETDPLKVSVTRDGLESFCVWVVVTDREGAQAFAGVPRDVTDMAPSAVIDVVRSRPVNTAAGLYELYSAFQLTGTRSNDPEGVGLTFRWEVTDPAGKLTIDPACPAPTMGDACFPADAPGPYVVEMQVFYKGSTSVEPAARAMRTFMVDQDRPPCIRVETATPPLGLPRIPRSWDEDVNFEVTVDDDGDPYPEVDGRLSMHEFVWFIRAPKATEFVRLGAGSSPRINIHVLKAKTYGIGDTVQVRVLYKDRVPRVFTRCEMMNPPTDACELRPEVKPPCYQWVTWTVQY